MRSSERWKLRHAFETSGKDNPDKLELYHLAEDPGETRDVAAPHPEVVKQLGELMAFIRAELGDPRLGIEGIELRPPAVSPNPKPPTTFNPAYPYIEPEYQLNKAG